MDNILSWNVRGLNRCSKQKMIRNFILNQDIHLFSLLETRVKAYKLGSVYINVCPGWCFSSNISKHEGGRIIIGWNSRSFQVDILHMTSQLIHCKVTTDHQKKFCCTFVYGLNDSKDRHVLWEDLQKIANSGLEAWICIGDFNSVLNLDERIGRQVRLHEVYPMRNCFAKCGLMDIKAVGHFFTWNNKQEGDNRVLSRIDRAVANESWCDMFDKVSANFLPEGTLDHSPVVLKHFDILVERKPFRFFNMWCSALNFQDLVKDAWNKPIQGCAMFRVCQRLKGLKHVFKELNKKGFNDIQTQDIIAYDRMIHCQAELQRLPTDRMAVNAETEARKEYCRVHKTYTDFLKQKAKVEWIGYGDENTKMFHQSLKIRRLKNTIHAIFDDGGNWRNDPEAVNDDFLNYYVKLLGSKMESREPVIAGIINLRPKVQNDQYKDLEAGVTAQEVKSAMFSIGNDKSPGLDGYGSKFYKETWNTVGAEIVVAVKDFFRTGKMLDNLNATSITLIPKVDCPKTVMDYRPISCCHVIYKCITKILCARLKKVLPSIIAENQGAFIEGRSILHNVLICQDLVKHYNRKSNHKSCMIKIDIKKAYDTVEWEFVLEMMNALNFPEHFTKLIKVCLTSTKYSLMINGGVHGYFEARRGLRQGDPLSPLLFVICMEYLSRIMGYIGKLDQFKFHPRCDKLKLNHLCFADDLLLFCRGDYISIYHMIQGLNLFSKTSGLYANNQKTAMYCSGMLDDDMNRIKEASGFSMGCLPFRYLGVPISTRKLKVGDCEKLIDNITAKIRIWQTRKISYAGRGLLVNSVLMSMQTYWGQMFILPKLS